MLISICNICKDIIKIGDKKIVIGINETIEIDEEPQGNYIDKLHRLQEQRNKVKVVELCVNCKKVLDHVLKLRKEEVQMILNGIEKSMGGEKE